MSNVHARATSVVGNWMRIAVVCAISLAALLGVSGCGKRADPPVTLRVFLVDGTTTRRAQELRAALAKRPGAESVRYLSKDDAFAEAKAKFKNDPSPALQMDNPFPAELRARFSHRSQARNAATRIRGQDGVQPGKYGTSIARLRTKAPPG